MHQRIHCPVTTAPQRRLRFATGEATGAVARAWRTAHGGCRTCYTGKPRFRTGGDAALDHFPSRAPNRTRRTPDPITAQGIALRPPHPAWGNPRLADDLANAHDGLPLGCPPTVNRILRAAGRGDAAPVAAKKGA